MGKSTDERQRCCGAIRSKWLVNCLQAQCLMYLGLKAIEALKHMPSLPTATSLLRALLDPKCFYKIRMEAAYALAKVMVMSAGGF